MHGKKRYSRLEARILATLNGFIGLEDIPEVVPSKTVWLTYITKNEALPTPRETKREKKYYSYRKRERYLRDESVYSKGQEEEFPLFLKYLEPAVNYVLDLYMPAGSSFEYYERLRDNLICLSLKKYFGKSLRRSMGIIRYIVKREFPDVKVPCFKTLNNYQNNSVVSYYVDKILEETSKPLSKLETRFTTDGTGEGTFSYSTWYSIKVGKKCRRRDHKIAEVTSTVRLNAAVVVDVLDHEDPNLMRQHVKITSQHFTVKHWSADSFYLMRDNCNSVRRKGGQAHVRIKSNTNSKSHGSFEWKRTVMLQKQKDVRELDELNLRQNAEATNSAKKRKFGSFTLGINEWSQVNDIKISWTCYNFSVLSRAYYEYSIVPDFLTHKFSRCFLRLSAYT